MPAAALPDFPPMITITGPPIPIEPRFAASLASIVIEWSRVETGIQTDLENLRQYPGIQNLSIEMPRAFDKMIKLWRRSVRHLYPAIESYQMVADNIRDRACDLAPKRNHLIHGLWDIDGVTEAGVWTVRSYKAVKGGGYQILRSDVDADSLEGTARAIVRLSGDIMGFLASRMMHARKGLLKVSRES
ncbi:MAG: hypothetical protein QOD42_2922 [Sphingomonadales bacterium]|jgi:hypothetical protein|nr:hypothetical protein [Sphingomonadales bacterium]